MMVVTKCLKIDSNNIVFDFKGQFKGENIHIVKSNNVKGFKEGKDYILKNISQYEVKDGVLYIDLESYSNNVKEL